ncbi:hypothetical protein CI109_100794 [Kwoniella shandongensis]|uniref:Non-structural maintenance of chromosomes element 1 homolog n=1 Tax=Kwoniella shandongensis TaxID=1734106 RepID=A0A5M6BUV8_9TREE|nr:uncharacterized protein CI109_005027 [Kwoniella shandongensis]KAA5526637.1 hypothetical protein CI109_005027 [Kwoniella shandongensis]
MANDVHAPRATNLHKLFIQSMLSRRAAREHVVLELYKRAISACQAYDDTFRPTHRPDLAGLNAFMVEATELLHDLGMEFVRGQEQTGKGKGWIVLRNIDPTEVALQATDYSSNEVDFYRKVIEGVILSYPAYSVSHRQATSIVSELKTQMTRSNAESLLDSLCSRGWLSKSQRGRYTLGVRGAVELEPYLKQEYEGDIHNCRHCKRLLLAGCVCSQAGCSAHFHSYCYDSLVKLPRASCPDCKTRFFDSVPKPIGETAVPRAEDDFSRKLKKRKRGSAVNGKGKGRADEDGDADEDVDTDDDELEDEEGADPMEASAEGSGFVERGAGPSGWQVDSTSRKSVVPETQFDEDNADEEDEDEEEEQQSRPANRRRSGRR